MILKKIDNLKKSDYEVVIFGSGPAGMSIALQFEKHKIKTLLIEAGDVIFNEQSQDFYKCKIIGEDYGDMSMTRLRQLGGTSGHWTGICRPLDSYDFKTWPINHRDLLAYQEGACNVLQLKNNFKSKKINNNFQHISYQKSNVRFGNFENFLKKSKYIDLINNLSLTNFIADGSKITGATLTTINLEKITLMNAKNFVIACGCIENNRIMLNFKKNFPKYFTSNMPLGNYYMDHPVIEVANGIIEVENLKKVILFNNLGIKLLPKDYNFQASIAPTNEFINNNEILNAEYIFNFSHYQNNKFLNKYINDLQKIAPNYSKKLNKLINKKKLLELSLSCSPEQDAIFENKITLNKKEIDKFGINRPIIHWKKSNLMKKTQKICLENIGKFFVEKNMGRIGIFDFIYDSQLYANAPNSPGIHHLGGTRMGNNENDSVVNSDLKFHNLDNLFICGGSVFRSSGHANPTLTIVQLALRLSDHLKTMLL